jgi:Alcohol dehydrogenase GroES-like domain
VVSGLDRCAAAVDEGVTMKALVYRGPGHKDLVEAPDPRILQPTDVIVRIDTTTICGTDLHILKGDVPAVTEGCILGHDGVVKRGGEMVDYCTTSGRPSPLPHDLRTAAWIRATARKLSRR